jgi:hypothetical protein
MNHLEQIGIAIDQLLNAICKGWADETFSARTWRHRDTRKRTLLVINSIFFWQTNHCKEAYESEINRKQLPIEYRK